MPDSKQQDDNVFLIDASIYIFQSHFSPYVECYDHDGNELSAVYGFSQFLLQFLRRVRPNRIAVAHDESLFCGFRHQICPDYKSNRELPDENLEMQLRACFELGELLGLSAFSSTVYEADDIIGTLSSRMRSEADGNLAVHIVSKDKDLAQLLTGSDDCLWDFTSNKRRFRQHIEEEFGVSPEQFPDYLGLIGDAVDCISGVPGVGPVKARELLQRYEDMDHIYSRMEEIPTLPFRGAKRLAQLLAEHKELAERSKLLATIVCDVENEEEGFSRAGLEDLHRGEVDLVALNNFLLEYGFGHDESRRIRSLAEQLAQQ